MKTDLPSAHKQIFITDSLWLRVPFINHGFALCFVDKSYRSYQRSEIHHAADIRENRDT